MGKHEIHAGNIGTLFKARIKDDDEDVDLSETGATLEFFAQSPASGAALATWTASVSTVDTGNVAAYMEYSTQSGDLGDEGEWEIQAHVVLPASGLDLRTDIQKFVVHENLD